MKIGFFLPAVLALFSDHLYAISSEQAVSTYQEEAFKQNTFSWAYSQTVDFVQEEENGYHTTFDLGLTLREFEFLEDDNIVISQQLDGSKKYLERFYNLGITQGFGVGTDVSLSYGTNVSDISKGRSYGLSLSQWFREETLQVVLQASRVDSAPDPVETLDTDRAAIRTPDNITGTSYELSLMHYTTPTTISRSRINYTSRSDRPPAYAAWIELREATPSIYAAWIFDASHYVNKGKIEQNTLYGEVKASSFSLTYNQRYGPESSFITSLRYRYYLEAENPRAENRKDTLIGSDLINALVRYRFGENVWTQNLDELYFGTSRYITRRSDIDVDDEPVYGVQYSLGAKIFF